jgi:hypothetical protein
MTMLEWRRLARDRASAAEPAARNAVPELAKYNRKRFTTFSTV